VVGGLIAVALVAGYIQAWRASRIDPLEALRGERAPSKARLVFNVIRFSPRFHPQVIDRRPTVTIVTPTFKGGP
jgi:hypothetical protein